MRSGTCAFSGGPVSWTIDNSGIMLRQIHCKSDVLPFGGSVSPGNVVPVGKGIADVHRFCTGESCASVWFPEFWRGGTGFLSRNRAASFLTIRRRRILVERGNILACSVKIITTETGMDVRLRGAVPCSRGRNCDISKNARISNPFTLDMGLPRGLRVKMFIIKCKHSAAAPFFKNPIKYGIARSRATGTKKTCRKFFLRTAVPFAAIVRIVSKPIDIRRTLCYGVVSALDSWSLSFIKPESPHFSPLHLLP